MPASAAIPIIDLDPYYTCGEDGARAVAHAVDEACRSLGFLIITGHRVDAGLISRMRAVSAAFFALSEAEKLTYLMPPDRYRGYTPMASEGLAATLGVTAPPDLKESFSIGPVDADTRAIDPAAGNFFAPNFWPDGIDGFRGTWTAYYREMERLATDLMRIFARALRLDPAFFDDKVDRHISNFSVIRYPRPVCPPLPGQLRAGAHTDYGSLTILQRDGAPGGLQVAGPGGDWIDVPDIAGTFVVNLGDLMAEWTNDVWRSTLHRVINPPESAGEESDRISMPFFHQPNHDAVITCIPTCAAPDRPPRYGTTTSGAHVLDKIARHRLQPAPEGGVTVEMVS